MSELRMQGNDIYSCNGGRIGESSNVQGLIDGAHGIILAALCLLFIK